MSALSDVHQATRLALENLAKAQDSAAQAVATANYAVDRAESLGIGSWIEGSREIQATVTAAAKTLASIRSNLEQARTAVEAMGVSTGSRASALVRPGWWSSTSDRIARQRPQPVQPRRSHFVRNYVLPASHFGPLGWFGVLHWVELPPRLGSLGYLIIGGTGVWLQSKFRTLDGVPQRIRRRRRGNGTMKIKRKTERAVRKALASAVIGEVGRLDAAVRAINGQGTEFIDQVLDLVFAIGTASLRSIHHGDRPADRQLRMMAMDFVEYEDWSGVKRAVVVDYLTALADEIVDDEEAPDEKRPMRVALAGHDPVFAACAVGGWLLSAFIPDEVEWTDFLDGVLDRLEST